MAYTLEVNRNVTQIALDTKGVLGTLPQASRLLRLRSQITAQHKSRRTTVNTSMIRGDK